MSQGTRIRAARTRLPKGTLCRILYEMQHLLVLGGTGSGTDHQHFDSHFATFSGVTGAVGARIVFGTMRP
jgi:hypothetical protein